MLFRKVVNSFTRSDCTANSSKCGHFSQNSKIRLVWTRLENKNSLPSSSQRLTQCLVIEHQKYRGTCHYFEWTSYLLLAPFISIIGTAIIAVKTFPITDKVFLFLLDFKYASHSSVFAVGSMAWL